MFPSFFFFLRENYIRKETIRNKKQHSNKVDGSHLLKGSTFLLVCFVCLKENGFHFTLKALFVLEIIKF